MDKKRQAISLKENSKFEGVKSIGNITMKEEQCQRKEEPNLNQAALQNK